MCKHMGIRHAKTVAYHSWSNGRAEVAGRQMFEKFRQLHIDEPGRNWYNSLWRVLQAYHDLPGPTGLSPHRILCLRDRVSRTLPWLNHGKVARDANPMMAEADDTAAKVCKALQDEHDKRAKYFKQGKVQKYALQDTVWVERHHKDVLSRQSAGILVCAGGNRAEGPAGCVCGSCGGKQDPGPRPYPASSPSTRPQRTSCHLRVHGWRCGLGRRG